jgi:molybdate transport system ATP-binding protein
MVYVSHQFDEVLNLATHLIVMNQGEVVAAGDVGKVSLAPPLRRIVGADAVGAVIEGRVSGIDGTTGLAAISIGAGILHVAAGLLRQHQPVRLQLLARDMILALEEPRGISVRNHLKGKVRAITADGTADLVEVETGGGILLARITSAATRELSLREGVEVWALVKAVSVNPYDAGPISAA